MRSDSPKTDAVRLEVTLSEGTLRWLSTSDPARVPFEGFNGVLTLSLGGQFRRLEGVVVGLFLHELVSSSLILLAGRSKSADVPVHGTSHEVRLEARVGSLFISFVNLPGYSEKRVAFAQPEVRGPLFASMVADCAESFVAQLLKTNGAFESHPSIQGIRRDIERLRAFQSSV